MRIKLRRAPKIPREPIGTRAERRAVVSQYLMPKRRMTAFAGRVASREGGRTARSTIRWFVRKYDVDLSDALEPDVSFYTSFNAFFTRALKPGARPIADTELVSPVDGSISQFGTIEHGGLLQAKGHRYSTATLLADAQLATRFDDGHFATLYLSPRDYHRIHMPCDGRLLRMIHVPGDLFSVNPTTARGVPGLFARNERTVCVFERLGAPEGTERAIFVVVLVGATIVGSMATVWHGVIDAARRSARRQRIRDWHYDREPVVLEKGAEMGRFLLGSTVVLLFPRGPLVFNPAWESGCAVRVGEAMAASPERAPWPPGPSPDRSAPSA